MLVINCFFKFLFKPSRNMGAVIDYMGKVSYHDAAWEQMVVANPNTTVLKAAGTLLSTGTKCLVSPFIFHPGAFIQS